MTNPNPIPDFPAFVQWLAEQPADHQYYTCDCRLCPLAWWLTFVLGRGAVASYDGVRLLNDSHDYDPALPPDYPWPGLRFQHFISRIDALFVSVSASDALNVAQAVNMGRH